MVCLFHWDLPQSLQDGGGWLNQETVGLFGDYARLVYQTFGDRVRYWITMNEPFTFCYYGYDEGIFAPGDKSDPATHPYSCVHSLIMGHALAYRIYKEEFFTQQNGKVGISLDNFWQEPADPNSEQDKLAAQQSYSFRFDWIAYPLFRGEYPPIMRKIIDAKSKLEGRKESRLPEFDAEWISKVNGSLDFLGINHFTTQLVKFANNSTTQNASNWESDTGTVRSYDPNWPDTGSHWLKVVPEGIRKSLKKIKQDYQNPEVIITENGVSVASLGMIMNDLDDLQRIEYHRLYINQVLKAVKIDGCNVTGYVVWSLLDGFEWSQRYDTQFGIFHVDHQSPNRTRTPKKSVKVLQQIFRDNGFPSVSKLHKISVISVSAQENKYSGTTVLLCSAPFALMFSAYYAYGQLSA
ncbi:Lactase-phlorizin hydrolase [Folsomia candida]|uniref:beta-glucosidase n=2 Tax=Folsomia candida TaxID=158441 RepID=A0A226D7G0_FOLCA|nr:Lactase-phlorizin hydrolase [Folsomia candida]